MNKIAFISGSSKGIGKQIGIDLLNNNYFVYFNGHTQESTKALEKELPLDLDYSIICQDLSTIESNISLGKWFKEKNINFDVLVLNLGITDRTPFGQITPSGWNKVFETNLSGTFFLIQELKNNINANGKIIFISSISGNIPDSVSIPYGVSKAAINMLAPYLAKEFKDKNITVNSVSPGYISSDWHLGKSKAQLKRIASKCLLNRFGTTKEISKVIMSIIDNDYINGQNIQVNGGWKHGC